MITSTVAPIPAPGWRRSGSTVADSTADLFDQSAEYELTGDQAWRRDYYYDGPGDQAVVNNAYAMEHACEETE